MNISLTLLATHFIADFVLQSNYMAMGKSKQWKPLLSHTIVYSICFLPWGFWLAFVTFILHTLVDYITSRCTSKLWFIELGKPYATNLFDFAKVDARKRHWFFVCIGLDQLIHFVALALTYNLLK